MDFAQAAKLGSYLAKDHAAAIFRLLVNYRDISASEAASRLNLHIRTVQEFLEAMAEVGVLDQVEVTEKKRPYNRFSLKNPRLVLEIDLESLYRETAPAGQLARRIRERRNARARFAPARYQTYFGSVTVWLGEGRQREERRINLTEAQGRFLYHLPFPSAEPRRIAEIMAEAGVAQAQSAEILDIVSVLDEYNVIEEPSASSRTKEDKK